MNPLKLNQASPPRGLLLGAVFSLVLGGIDVRAQTGPFDPTNWPSTIVATATVDYYIVDQNATFSTPAGWNQTVSFAGGGDQAFASINLSGLVGDQSTSSFMNIADSGFRTWATVPTLDILLQVRQRKTLQYGWERD